MSATQPKVLFVYFTYTKQTLKVVEAMTDVFLGRGCEVENAAIDLTDARYTARFHEFPMPHPFRELIGMIPAELLALGMAGLGLYLVLSALPIAERRPSLESIRHFRAAGEPDAPYDSYKEHL